MKLSSRQKHLLINTQFLIASEICYKIQGFSITISIRDENNCLSVRFMRYGISYYDLCECMLTSYIALCNIPKLKRERKNRTFFKPKDKHSYLDYGRYITVHNRFILLKRKFKNFKEDGTERNIRIAQPKNYIQNMNTLQLIYLYLSYIESHKCLSLITFYQSSKTPVIFYESGFLALCVNIF